MEGGSSRGSSSCGGSSKKNNSKKSRPQQTQTPAYRPQMNPNEPVYRPQMNPNPYFYNQQFPFSQHIQQSPPYHQQFSPYDQPYNQPDNQWDQGFNQQADNEWGQQFDHDTNLEDNLEQGRQPSSDSSDPTPEEQPLDKKKKGKAQAKKWSDDEEVALCKAFLIWTAKGNNMKRDGFWNEVTKEFHTITRNRSRTKDQVYSKWGDLNAQMKKFNGIYQQVLSRRGSGEGDEQLLTKALRVYKDNVRARGFDHVSAWDEVRTSPLWCDIPPVGYGSQPPNIRGRTPDTAGSEYAEFHADTQNLDDDDTVQLDRDGPRIYYEPERPSRKGKRSAASSSSHEELIQKISDFNTFTKEDAEEKRRMREE